AEPTGADILEDFHPAHGLAGPPVLRVQRKSPLPAGAADAPVPAVPIDSGGFQQVHGFQCTRYEVIERAGAHSRLPVRIQGWSSNRPTPPRSGERSFLGERCAKCLI